jgi:type I restriction enzyme M protein
VPKTTLTTDDHAKNNLPDILARWRRFRFGVPASAGNASESQQASKFSKPAGKSHAPPPEGGTPSPELARPRTAQSFCVPKADLAAQGYDLSLNRYKEVVHAEVAHRPPQDILKSLAALEKEITTGMKQLEDMLK